jgi:arylsulfatase
MSRPLLGVLPENVANPADHVRPWNTLNADEKKLFARMAEVYAGLSEYTDAQIGRIVDYREQSGQLENTIVFYCSDNGTSGEGSPNGSVNENKFFNNYPDELAENMKYLDVLGSVETCGHFPTGWAAAFSTPFKMFSATTSSRSSRNRHLSRRNSGPGSIRSAWSSRATRPAHTARTTRWWPRAI